MKLLGHYMSPYTRRVAVTLNMLRLQFELDELSVMQSPERVRPHNPTVRIPVLILDDSTPLIDSTAILDEIDQMVGPERALTPAINPTRRKVVQLTAVALSAMEKCQWGFYERRFKPEDKVHQGWIDHNNAQCLAGLRYLDEIARGLPAGGWLAGTPAPTQADISTAVFLNWMREGRPDLELSALVPALCAFADRCEQLAAFKASPQPKSEPGRPGVYLPKVKA